MDKNRPRPAGGHPRLAGLAALLCALLLFPAGCGAQGGTSRPAAASPPPASSPPAPSPAPASQTAAQAAPQGAMRVRLADGTDVETVPLRGGAASALQLSNPPTLRLAQGGGSLSLTLPRVPDAVQAELWAGDGESCLLLKNPSLYDPDFTLPLPEAEGTYAINLLPEYEGEPAQEARSFRLVVGAGRTALPKDAGPLPYYVQALAQGEDGIYAEVEVKRTDLGLSTTWAPMHYQAAARALADMKLVPYAPGSPALAVKAPFSLTFRYGGREDVFTFTAEKITCGGAGYTPQNPGALAAIYAADDEGFLTGKLLRLGDALGLAPGEVGALTITASGYEGETTLELADPTAIDAILANLGESVVRPLAQGEEAEYPAGGVSLAYAWRCKDGATRTYQSDTGLLQLPGHPAQRFLEVSGRHGAAMQALSQCPGVPVAAVALPQGTPKVYQTAFTFAGSQKLGQGRVPADMHYELPVVLPPGEAAAFAVSFHDGAGAPLAPASLTVTAEGLLSPLSSAVPAPARPLAEKGGRYTLPGEAGDWLVTLQAAFPAGEVTSLFLVRVSSLPPYFGSISFGNGDDAVTVARDDVGISIPGGQNRLYVQLLGNLALEPGAQGEALPVRKPFTLTFSYMDGKDVFRLAQDGITYNGAPYRAGNPAALEKLYMGGPGAPVSGEVLDKDVIDHRLRGFLTAELSRLPQAAGVGAADLTSLTLYEEKPKSYLAHPVNLAEAGGEAQEALSQVVLARAEQPPQYFWPLRFFTSFAFTTKDGHTYRAGETLARDGVYAGWYVVNADSPAARRLLAQSPPEAEVQRDMPLPGGLSVDDAGNITPS